METLIHVNPLFLKDDHKMANATSALPPGLDLTTLTPAALDELAKAIEREKKAAHARELDAVKTKIKNVLDSAGLAVADLAQLFPSATRSRSPASPPAYRHPDKPGLTWKGKGRKPIWITDFLAQGGKLETLKVK